MSFIRSAVSSVLKHLARASSEPRITRGECVTFPRSTKSLESFRLRLHEAQGEFHPGMSSSRGEILISFTRLISPQDERKTVSSRDEINVQTYLGVFGFCFYKMAVLAVNRYAQYDHSPLVIRREAQKNVISARDRKESSVYMDF